MAAADSIRTMGQYPDNSREAEIFGLKFTGLGALLGL
jgi:hypothetical protein